MYEGDELVGDELRRCGRNTVAAVEGGGEVVEVLRRGFVMKWRASECGACERSGGRCGFNETTYLFRCFCPNRPRYWLCRSDKDRPIVTTRSYIRRCSVPSSLHINRIFDLAM
ncbi:LEAF RUST 10 DISEASE-RESISTANCE LOCUS RECEPTOR-LIKE PROTEIN KINASE-like 1.2 isoform X2 [Salvia splendens]|uniref:LEAF RUST 10 DISEASE-RESISTANCE LOCUS RECEPTOR-LIKE PROTEIN KINASE-like 1.2 isoform X2 n=1 Tax=Salvia splendens TaxID=180675 RepID=UPI001C2659BF|nr:LEAF RUST 10 DISEASE-RESISTANCE LOCUS RECEPTOR-LIKE PROTEIN KINASE-like 1.2 isoform X2 [Salvia splendens]